MNKECCGNKIDHEFCFTSNTFSDHLAQQSAFWAGPLGWTVAGVVVSLTENLNTFKINSTKK